MFAAVFFGVILLWFASREVMFTFFATPARLNDPRWFEMWRPIVGGFVTGISAAWVCYSEKWFVDEAPDEHSPEVER